MADEKTTAATQGAETQTAENKTTEAAETTTAKTTDTQTDTKTEGGDKPKTFTQDELNRLLAKEKRDWEKQVKDAEEKAKLSEDERTKAEL
ncbi:MAG: hypothetical protein ACREBC_32240, partial [Pyrinomonadaceae bacterium]